VIAWLIPGKLARATIPDNEDLKTWKEAGIQSVVNLLEDYYEDITAAEMRHGFKVLHSPILDMHAPSIEQLSTIVRWINQELYDGKKVLVHCYAGIGRTGLVLTAYLVAQGEEMSSALTKVNTVGSKPQTQEQFDILEEFSRLQGKNK
jgi:protein-tyrosine phosphatase